MMHTFKLYTYIKTTIILRQKKIISTIKYKIIAYPIMFWLVHNIWQ
jgi:hypothetical protein